MANKLTLSAVGFLSLLAAGTFAQTATTTPVGFMRFAIAGGTLAAPATTAIAIPLHDVGGVNGLSSGTISSIGNNTVTVSAAGWTSGALSIASIPYAFCVKNGAAEGAIYKITANTETTLTLDVADLVAAGVTVGNRFEIIPLDTLKTFFGNNTLLGGTNKSNSDVVYLMSGGIWSGYIYSTNYSKWVPSTARDRDMNDVILWPGSGILIERRSGPIEIVVTGTVPTMKYRMGVANSGGTLVHSGFPTDVTLGTLSAQNLLPGWKANTNAADSDWLFVMEAGIWTSYYFNGNYWRKTARDRNSDSVAIPAGTPFIIQKQGSASGVSYIQRELPYQL